ncbi:unnamed protein product [Didymodactylos carnosus]|uniref:Ammonium transporter AmtB-like domain-containing protein n=1 Tax=Didymodactylos carnosus TaxID=1234261 RepID=A0A814LNQ0_9BILA|nr:unnamed protein product [Didymodactylos carnosus]CAF1067183.1 unnamed protein product [Didymodactylos carnosus]CAF3752934.1 unnamed protein product [Didymodactylos carnosus]CAF3834739.1 unnamed protein product [Didymodactylos carnosus]
MAQSVQNLSVLTASTSTSTIVPITIVYNTGDNAWMMVSTALVLMMTPALAFFYGGMVHNKNILNQLFLSIICMGIVFCQWVLFGFSFAFGPAVSKGFGSFKWACMLFGEGTFAIITPALISGAVAGRMKLIPYMIFIFVWTTVCYDPLAHWVWGDNGWLKLLGTLDFAGGTVVHISSGISGFVASIILGKRYDVGSHGQAHNLPFTVLGTSLLWVCSAGNASGLAALAMMNSNAAAAAGLMTWVIIDAIRGSISISGACAGPIVGLVAITPACGFVQPGWALLIGVIGTLVVYSGLQVKKYIGVDDALDCMFVHGIGGIAGAFVTGLFCQARVNSGGADGAFYGRPIQLWYQIAGILTTIAFAGLCTAGILLPMKYTIGIRLDREDEVLGLDHTAHGESWEAAEPGVRGSISKVEDVEVGEDGIIQFSATMSVLQQIMPNFRPQLRVADGNLKQQPPRLSIQKVDYSNGGTGFVLVPETSSRASNGNIISKL